MNKGSRILTKYLIIFGLLIFTMGLDICTLQSVYAEEMYMSQDFLTLQKGKKKKLKVKNIKKNVKVKWSTSNKFAATVSKKGKVKAVNDGTAIIKAKVNKKVFTCMVTVPDDARTLTLNTETIVLKESQTYSLIATSKNKVSYTSSNTDIITVDKKGKITANNPGVAVVTAASKTDYARCLVTVTANTKSLISQNWMFDKDAIAIRQVLDSGEYLYNNISWAKGNDLKLKIANIDESLIKKCDWTVSNDNVVTTPVKDKQSMVQVSTKTLKMGFSNIKAEITYKNGRKATYSNIIYVTNPTASTNDIKLLGQNDMVDGSKYISIKGLSPYSKVIWSNSDYGTAVLKTEKTKTAIVGLKDGKGTITAQVDGKTLTINYTVQTPKIKEIKPIIAKGKTTKIKIMNTNGMTPVYKSRNSKVAAVDATGKIKGINAGVTYIDVQLDNATLTYRVEVAAKGMITIVKRAQYIVNNWTYSQAKRMSKGYYDCSALVWKGYSAYKKYNKKLGSSTYALPAATLFDYLNEKKQIINYGYMTMDDMQPGDLIFYGDYDNAVKYSTPGRTLDIYHVSMYAGNGEIVEKGGRPVESNSKYIVGIGRVVK